MSPEIKVNREKVAEIMIGLPCSDEECSGEFIAYTKQHMGKWQHRILCSGCGQEVIPESAKVVYETKEK